MGLGGVIRNGKREWHSGFEEKIYASDPLAIEILVIQKAFYPIEANQLQNATIYSNCKNAIELILKQVNSNKYFVMVDLCR